MTASGGPPIGQASILPRPPPVVVRAPAATAQARVKPGWIEALRGQLAGVSGRLGWLMVDQAVFAITNMVLNVMFARWLTPEEYGLYALSFSAFIFLSVMHWATVIEPMLVQSASIGAEYNRSFVLKLILVQLGLLGATTVLAALVWGLATAYRAPDVAAGGAAALLGGPMVLLLLTARRLCLVFLSARLSAQVGVGYLVCALATAWGLHSLNAAPWWSLWVVMAAWSLVGAVFISSILLRQLPPGEHFPLRDLVHFQARYARVGCLGACSSWLRSDGFAVILAHFVGLAAVAETRAMAVLANPIVQANGALNATWLVHFSRSRGQGGLPARIARLAAVYGGGAVLVVVTLALLHSPLVRIVYGGRYGHVSWQFPLFCLASCINGLESMLTSVMKASDRAWFGYVPQIVGSITVLSCGALLASQFGQAGAPFSTLTAAGTGFLIALLLFRNVVRRSSCRP